MANTQTKQQSGNTASAKELRRRHIILNKNLWLVFLLIAGPLILTNAVKYFYGILDTIIVADLGSNAVSSVAIINQIVSMLTALGTGLAAGGAIMIGKQIGAKNYQNAKKLASTVVLVAVIACLGVIAVSVPLSQVLLKITNTPQEVIDDGLGYFIIQLISASIHIVCAVFLGLERSRGAAYTSAITTVLSMIIKVTLTLMVVNLIPQPKLYMVGVATLVADMSVLIYAIVMLAKKNYLFHFSLKNIDNSKPTRKELTRLSFPIFLGRFVFSLGKVIVNAMCGHYGKNAAGALGVSNNIGGSVTNLTSSMEEASSAIISQNLGNGNSKRAISAFWCGMIINVVISAVGMLILFLFRKDIVMFFAKEKFGEESLAFAAQIDSIVKFEMVALPALGITSAIMGMLYGYGYTRLSLFMNLARLFVFRIPPLFIMINFTNMGSESIGYAMMISNIGIGLMAIAAMVVILPKIKKLKFSVPYEALDMETAETTEVNNDTASQE